MFHHLKKAVIAALAVATLAGTTTAAEARDRYYRDRGDDAAIAIGAGLVGLAIGAAIADRGDRYYYDRSYYPHRRYVNVRGYPGYYYYYPAAPRVYYRDRYYDRYYRPYYRNYYRDRGYRYRDRGYRYDRRGYGRGYRDGRRHYRRHDRRGYRGSYRRGYRHGRGW